MVFPVYFSPARPITCFFSLEIRVSCLFSLAADRWFSFLKRCHRVAVEGARFTPKSRVIVAVSAEVGAAAVCAMTARWGNAARRLKIECCTACVRFADATPGQGGFERWVPSAVESQ